MIRMAFASLVVSLIAGCAVAPAGEETREASEELLIADRDELAFSSTATFTSLATEFYIPPHTGGDADFGGHGPFVDLQVQLHVFNGNELWASVYMNAKETKSDWTQAEGTGWYHLTTAPSNIVGILSPSFFAHEYTDDDHDRDFFAFVPSNLVAQLEYVGDTKGNEAGSRTGVQVSFQAVTVALQ